MCAISWKHWIARSRDLRSLKAKICAIGPATRAAVEALHLRVDVMPNEYVAESLLEALASEDLKGKRMLLPRAAVARDLVPVALAERGAHGGCGGSLPHDHAADGSLNVRARRSRASPTGSRSPVRRR